MNFFGHAVVACCRSEAAAFVLGSMLPDFAAMIRARSPTTSHQDIRAGIAFHHRTDEFFHQTPAFLELCRTGFTYLQEHGLRRGSARAATHVGIELMLDSALVREVTAATAYLDALAVSGPDQLGSQVAWRAADEPLRFEQLRLALRRRGLDTKDAEPMRVAERVERTLSGRPRLALVGSERDVVAHWVRDTEVLVHRRASEILSHLRSRLANGGGADAARRWL
jgi:acyl carrier protein phosphodiesterase